MVHVSSASAPSMWSQPGVPPVHLIDIALGIDGLVKLAARIEAIFEKHGSYCLCSCLIVSTERLQLERAI